MICLINVSYVLTIFCQRRLTDERDSLAAHCIQLTLDTLSLKERDLHPPPSPVVKENSGLTLELADTKSRLRRYIDITYTHNSRAIFLRTKHFLN